jgi:hypothetical protein
VKEELIMAYLCSPYYEPVFVKFSKNHNFIIAFVIGFIFYGVGYREFICGNSDIIEKINFVVRGFESMNRGLFDEFPVAADAKVFSL